MIQNKLDKKIKDGINDDGFKYYLLKFIQNAQNEPLIKVYKNHRYTDYRRFELKFDNITIIISYSNKKIFINNGAFVIKKRDGLFFNRIQQAIYELLIDYFKINNFVDKKYFNK